MLPARPLAMLDAAVVRDPTAPFEDVPPTAGGGGITAELSEVRRDIPVAAPSSETLAEGGGGTMLAPSDVRRAAEGPAEAAGGGGMMFAASAVPPLLRELPDAAVEGGGGTTSCVPKSFPITLLTNDVFPAWEGGGGTTAGLLAPTLPLSRRRRSRDESADGGGAITEGAGRLSFAVRTASRAGAGEIPLHGRVSRRDSTGNRSGRMISALIRPSVKKAARLCTVSQTN